MDREGGVKRMDIRVEGVFGVGVGRRGNGEGIKVYRSVFPLFCFEFIYREDLTRFDVSS